jgi:hypothetical protein
MARENCAYCGAPLPAEVLEAAALAAERVFQSKSLDHLEAAARGLARDQPKRRYLVIDTADTTPETLARACSISVWEARQWRASSRYRLLKVGAESDRAQESGFKENGLTFFAVPESTVAPGRNPIVVESVDLAATPLQCTLRRDPEAPAARQEFLEQDVVLIVSAWIKRERIKDAPSLRARADPRLQDAFLVHLHLSREARPWEIDPRWTGYEGASLSSAHMSTLDLIRYLSVSAPHDQAFRTIVPALSLSTDPPSDLAGLKKPAKGTGKDPKVTVLDNAAQFREYSAWRGAVEKQRLNLGRG